MKNNREWRALALLFGLAFADAAAHAGNVQGAQLPDPGGWITVAQSRRGYEHIELPTGPIRYSEAADNEGYFPGQSITIVASRHSRAVDYPGGITAFELGDRAEAALRQQNYRIAFRCTGQGCGDTDGWRLFLGDAVAGQVDSQYYLLAWREGEEGSREYAQYYVADLHGRPRLLLNTYFGEPLAQRPETGPLPVYFSTGSAVLSVHARESLRDWVAGMKLEPGSQLEVTGYADPQGSLRNNIDLSRERAAAVARWLAADSALAGIAIKRVAGGVDASAGAAGERVPLNRARRAEVRIIPVARPEGDELALSNGNGVIDPSVFNGTAFIATIGVSIGTGWGISHVQLGGAETPSNGEINDGQLGG
jgi:outer membrane protein OmpA-like peptidoglycan-associated protein